MGSMMIGGKQYRSIGSYKLKSQAVKVAKENRKGKWNSRVVKEGSQWTVYNRAKLR